MNTLSYKGFKASIGFDEDDNILVGHIVGINDVIGFHADSVEALRTALHEAVEDYIDACRKVGKQPEKAYSGKLMLRVDPQIHSRVAMAAELSGKSLNQWAEEVLATVAGRAVGSKDADGSDETYAETRLAG